MNHKNIKVKPIVIYGTRSLKDNGKIYVTEEDFEIPHGETFKLAINELNKIQNSTIQGKKFLTLFEYDDASLWWLIYPSLISKLKKLVNFIQKFYEMLEENDPHVIKIEKDFSYFNIIKQICYKKNIELKFSQKSLIASKARKKTIRSIRKSRYKLITNTKLKTRKKMFYENTKFIPSLKNKIIFTAPTVSRRININPTTLKSEMGETWQKFLDLLSKEGKLLGIDLDYTFKGDFTVLNERLKDNMDWVPAEAFIHKNHFHEERHIIFLKNYKNLISSKSFQNLFYFNGISLWHNLEEFFEEMTYSPYIPYYMKLIDSILSYFKNNKPKAVFFPYETGSVALCFIIALSKLKIKTIGIQHGIIYQYSSNYSFNEFATIKKQYGFPLPDYILLFGNFSKDILEKN